MLKYSTKNALHHYFQVNKLHLIQTVYMYVYIKTLFPYTKYKVVNKPLKKGKPKSSNKDLRRPAYTSNTYHSVLTYLISNI